MKSLLPTLATLLLATTPAWAHDDKATPPVSPLLAPLVQLRDAALASDYAYRQAEMITDIGPRLSGSAGAAAAVQRVAAALTKLGLEVKLEPVKVPHWVRGMESGALVDWPDRPAGIELPMVLTALGGSVATPAKGLTAPVVVVHSYEELQKLGREKVVGRIVLFAAAFDETMAAIGSGGQAYGAAVDFRTNGAAKAAALGAVAALNRSAGGGAYRLPHTGVLRYADGVVKIPAAAVTVEDALRIERLATKGEVKLRLILTPQTLPDTNSFNVVADLKGREKPEEVVVVSGHLDSWDLATGAIDDASGVAAAMQVANLLKQTGLTPRRTVRVIAWMNEENGLAGAKAYAAAHAGELGLHVAAIEMDIGAGHPTGLRAQVTAESLPALAPIKTALAPIGAGIVEYSLTGVGADIGPLAVAGVPGFAPLSDQRDYFTYHHTPADTFDKIKPHLLAENAAVLTTLVYGLAEGEILPRLPVTAP